MNDTWKVIVYDTMYGCTASGVIYSGDKATAKAIARHFNGRPDVPVQYEATND